MSMPGFRFFKKSIAAYGTIVVIICFVKENFASLRYRAILNAGTARSTFSEIMFNRIRKAGGIASGTAH